MLVLVAGYTLGKIMIWSANDQGIVAVTGRAHCQRQVLHWWMQLKSIKKILPIQVLVNLRIDSWPTMHVGLGHLLIKIHNVLFYTVFHNWHEKDFFVIISFCWSKVSVSLRSEIFRTLRIRVCCTHARTTQNHNWPSCHCCGLSLFWDGCNETLILGPQIVDYVKFIIFS